MDNVKKWATNHAGILALIASCGAYVVWLGSILWEPFSKNEQPAKEDWTPPAKKNWHLPSDD